MSEDLFKKTGKGLLILGAIILLVYLAFLFIDIITMFVVSVLLAFIFNPIVTILERKGLNRGLAVLSVMLTSIFILSIALGTIIPKITTQIQALANQVTQQKVIEILGGFEEELKNIFPNLETLSISSEITGFISSFLLDTVQNLSEILTSIFSVIALLVIVPFMTFFLLKDNTAIVKGMVNVVPNKYFEMSYWVIKKITLQLGKFVRAWIIDALFVGVLSSIGLTILGVENSITIGMIAGIGHLIPYFGPLIGGLPAAIIALLQFGDPSILLSIVIMFLIIYTIDNGYVQPRLLSHGTDIHPLMIIVLILLGSKAMGVMGMLLAVPLATVIKTASQEIYFGYKNYKIIHLK